MLWSVISTSEISLNMLATALLGLGLSQERENKKGKPENSEIHFITVHM